MAELDLSLSDALTDGAPQPGPESLVERDFVAQLEAEAFDDQVGETVGKTDYVPLLDNDDTRAGCKLTAGGQASALRPEPQGEVRPPSLDQQQASATDFLSAFSQPGVMGVNVEAGAAPLSAERIQSIAELQHVTLAVGSEAPKEHSPMLPEPQTPRSPLYLSSGALGDCWPDEASCLPTDLPFSPSVSTVISRHASHLAVSPDDPPDSWPSRESTAYAGGDEREQEGSDRKQKKKKKRRQKDEGPYEHLESSGHPEVQTQGENTPPTEEFYHRIGPRRDRGDGCWEEQLGKSGGRGKKGKSRKKLPEEWGVSAEPFVPSAAATSQVTEEVMMELGSSVQENKEASFVDMDASQSPWKKEVCPEDGLVPSPLSEDLFSPTVASINPLVLNSELKATAAPFTMPSIAPCPGDPFDLLMTENASLSNSSQVFSPGDDMVDSVMCNTSSLQESCVRGIPEGDTSAFSPASQPSPSLKGEVLASAPPLSPSDASWLLNDSSMSSNSELFDFSDVSTSGHPLTLGLSFDTSCPAPLRSPKTTAQEFQPKEHKDVKSSQKQPKKSRSSSSSSIKSPTSPGVKIFPAPASPAISPSSPQATSPGSGLNPTAKPFFPSFADPMEEPAVVPPIIEVKSDKMDKAEKKEEKSGDSVKNVDLFDPLFDRAEQKSVKVEYAISETPAKVEKEMEKEKQTETQKEKEKEAEWEKEKEKEKEIKDAGKTKEEKETDKVKVTEKVEEKKETEKEKEKVESIEQKAEKEDWMNKVVESQDKLSKTEKVVKVVTTEVESKVEKTDVGKVDKNEKSTVHDKTENTEKLEETKMKDGNEQHTDKAEKTPDQQPTSVKLDISSDELEKKADAETKATPEVGDAKKEKVDADKAKMAEIPMQKGDNEEKQDKVQANKKIVEKKDDKKDKAARADGAEKAKKAKPATNGSSAPLSRDLAVGKTKPAAGATKPSAAAKSRLSTTATGGSVTAPTKRPTSSNTTSISDKKTTTPKAPSTAAAGPKRPSTSSTSRPASSTTTTTARDVRPKTTTERRPLVPKASTATSASSTAATKNGTASTAASKTATSARMTAPTRTATTTAARRPLAPDSKPGEEKKPGALRTSTADSTKPKTTTSTTTTRSTAYTAAASRTRTAAAKPARPSSSTTGAVPEKKPMVPRTPRPTSSTTTTTASRTTARPSTAPAADIRNARSKIGSTDNMRHQPGGGRVPSTPQSRAAAASKETSLGKVQILNKKVDLSKVTSKCGSKDNIKHKPGGGVVKIESQKVSFRENAQSKVGSVDNLSHSPGGGDAKAEGAQETTEGSGTPLSGTSAPGPELGQAGSPATQENGLKEGAACDSEGLREPQALDSRIPETN